MIRKINNNVFEIGVRDSKRLFFDNFMPLAKGTSYNSYLIKGKDKIALIDTVEPKFWDEFWKNLSDGLEGKEIDYIISNHAEQDHSGCLGLVLEKFPKAKIIINKKSKDLLLCMIHLKEEQMIIVDDNQEISLGDKTLQFILTPWVHWPETMCTYLKEDKILFSCDLFGAHYSDDDLFVKNQDAILNEAKRYYAEIMMTFRTIVKLNLRKLENIEIKIIAPSHGQVYDKPEFIINAYNDWISDECKKKAVILYVTMHESTEIIAKYIENKLKKEIDVVLLNLTETDLGKIAMETIDAELILLGSPAFITGPHPVAANIAFCLNVLKPKAKYISFFGSYGWANKLEENLTRITENMKAEKLPSMIVKGNPKKENFEIIDKTIQKILTKIKQN